MSLQFIPTISHTMRFVAPIQNTIHTWIHIKLASIFVAEIIPYWEPFAALAMTNTSYFKRALLGMKELFTAGDYFLHYRRVFLHFSDCALPKDKAFDVSLH